MRTNAEGRTDGPLLAGEALRAGIYELVFGLGDYFAAVGRANAPIPFLGKVPVRFGISDPDANYHIPLLASPWAYSPGRITRPYGTPALAAARDAVARWMRDAGLEVRIDAVGNVRGRSQGSAPTAPALLLGSHLDSVRDAGRYDGPLGILVALEAVDHLRHRPQPVPFPVEVIGFADEEGLRFQTTYLGSCALAGSFEAAFLDLIDENGVTLREAMEAFGGDPDALAATALGAGATLAYLEVHIEQGPYLESVDAPVGVVTAISGQSRILAAFSGEAGHAGTVVMHLRRDPLPAAAEIVLATENLARHTSGLLATVGTIEVTPGASNVIPGQARFSIDVRHPEDRVRTDAMSVLERQLREVAASRSLGVEWRIARDHSAVLCDASLTARLAEAVAAAGLPVERLPSGAGHDAVVMSEVAPVGMLFVRCAGGISHHPAESVAMSDVAAAIDVL
ncbi:MAG: allantoate amidohydrolase, partial [Thermomicrobiales bacterium]|nr:allantoate amidohydrolase [Thermomicrobiales bacterium]